MSHFCALGPQQSFPSQCMHAMEWNSLIFNGLPMRCSLLHRAIWISDCYCLSSLLPSPLPQVCICVLSFATVVGASSARLSTIKRSYQSFSRHCWFSFLFAVCKLPPAVFIACSRLTNIMPAPGESIPHAHPSCPFALLPLSSPTECCPTTSS